MQTYDQIIKTLESLDVQLLKRFKLLYGSKANKGQLLDFVASSEFDDLINQSGLNELLGKHAGEFDALFGESLGNLPSLGESVLSRIVENAELIKTTNERTVLGYFKYQTERLRTHLVSGLVGGETFEDTIKSFGKGIVGQKNPVAKWHFFTEANVGTVIHTSYTDFGRTITADAFADEPEQKFEYVGGVIPTSSEQCAWLMSNQRADGYTKTEIDTGIQTPNGPIDWHGRIPNYNCIHQWLPKE